MNKFHDVLPIEKQNAEHAFESGDIKRICTSLVSLAFYERDWKYTQDKCLFYLNSPDPVISGLAATCLGHIARVHKQLDKSIVIPALKEKLKNDQISGSVRDALSDIEIFT